MIRALIFDVGGVLIRTEDRGPRAALEQRLGLEHGEADTIVFGSEMGQRAQRGEISAGELWGWVQKRLRISDEGLTRFQEEFFAGDRLDEALLGCIRRLHDDYQTAIISNAMDDLDQVIRISYPMADAFDLVVGSAYEGVMKPDPAIFLRTLERLGRRPAEAIFVDDFAHNVAGAQAVGLHAIHFTPATNLGDELAALGVTLPPPDRP